MKKDRIPTEQKADIDGADMDKIEVLMAVYNGSAYIREQIDSILNQTYENWHLTISDDGSTDGTDLIADEYAAKYPEQITRVYSGVRFGNARDHFMWLSENCTSRYMLYSDQDDVFNPEKMSRLMDAMQNAERQWGRDLPILVFSDQTVVDEKLNVIEPSLMRCQKQAFDSFDYHALLIQNVVTGGAMMVNRPLCSLAVQCRSRERIIMHDWWMAATAARFGKIIYLDEPLSLYRQHGGNSVGAKRVGSAGYIAGMMGNLRGVREMILRKKSQAGVFEETYTALLTAEDRQFLSRMKQSRSGIRFYLKNRGYIHGFFRFMGWVMLG
jgi:hypothetical protein